MADPTQEQLYRFKDIVFDVATNFGNTSQQAQNRIGRLVNRAAVRIAGGNRRWSWALVKDSFMAASGVEEYSLNQDVGTLQMVWLEGNNRQKLDRIPSRQFRELVPDPINDSGIPRLYDFNGVDSNGCKVITLYPIPSGQVEVFYRYRRLLLPIQNGETNVWARWGMPPNIIECLIEYATALSFKGIDEARHDRQLAQAEAMVLDAYGDDQENMDTRIRIPFDEEMEDEGEVLLPPQFGR